MKNLPPFFFLLRYYLEPASPLKSLASSQQLTTCATSSSSGTSSSTTTTTNVTLDNTAVLKSITLTPPQSLRLHNKNARSTAKGPVNFQHQFTPDSETGLFNLGNSQTRLNNNNNSSNGGGHQNGITSNLSGIVANNNNKFTPDADFVADFGSANIFNATQSSTTMVNNTANGTSKIVNGNVSSGQQQQQQINGNGGTNENFADFEHNPIYNSAGKYH